MSGFQRTSALLRTLRNANVTSTPVTCVLIRLDVPPLHCTNPVRYDFAHRMGRSSELARRATRFLHCTSQSLTRIPSLIQSQVHSFGNAFRFVTDRGAAHEVRR